MKLIGVRTNTGTGVSRINVRNNTAEANIRDHGSDDECAAITTEFRTTALLILLPII
jgi:hypothetical protein